MLDTVIITALVISYLLDKHVARQAKRVEIEKLRLETKKLALEIKKASR